MNSVTLPRASVEQWLEALEAMNPYPASKEDQRASALASLRAALAEPVQEPAAVVATQSDVWRGYNGQWAPPGEPIKMVQMLRDLPLGTLLYTAPPRRDALLQALQNLVSVCQRMDLEHQAERPSEAEYQTAMQAAQAAIQAVEGGA